MMRLDSIPTRLWHKFNGAFRLSMVHGLSSTHPVYVVNAYPKSGSSWVSQMLSEALDVPFPRNEIPRTIPCLIQGHFLRPGGIDDPVVVWRDGRDVVVSQYNHYLFHNDKNSPTLVEDTRRGVPFEEYDDLESNLADFIDFVFEDNKHPSFSWADFVETWSDRDVVHVTYEDLRRDTPGELRRVVHELVGDPLPGEEARAIARKYSFENQSGREPGEEEQGKFMRKGVVGDWENHFDREARETFADHAQPALEALGYEEDRSWVDGE